MVTTTNTNTNSSKSNSNTNSNSDNININIKGKENITSRIIFSFLQLLIWVYTYVSLPFYFLIQRPWKEVESNGKNRITLESENPPVWVRSPDDNCSKFTPPLVGCKTFSQLISLACSLYHDRNCFGFRQVLETKDVVDSSGKVLTKKRLGDEYIWLTFGQVDSRIDDLVAGLLVSGIRPGSRVALIMDGCLEWTLTAFAVTRMGGILVTVFPAISSDGIVNVLEECDVSLIVTDAATARHKITCDVLSKLPSVKTLVLSTSQSEMEKDRANDKEQARIHWQGAQCSVITLDHLENKGKMALASLQSNSDNHWLHDISNNNNSVNSKYTTSHLNNGIGNNVKNEPAEEEELSTLLSYPSPRPEDTALIMYSSGTTGKPKGVLYTQNHFVHAYKIGSEVLVSDRIAKYNQEEVYLSFLPPSHVFEFTIQFCLLASGSSVGFGSPFTAFQKGPRLLPGCLPDIQALNPTTVIAVPLLLERLRSGVCEQLSSKPLLLQKIFKLALEYRVHWVERGYSCPIVEKLLLKKTTRTIFGSRITKVIVGSAPLCRETQKFLQALLTANLRQGYGMTEAFALVSVCDRSDWSLGSVGSIHTDVKIRLLDWQEGGYHLTDSPHPRGELLVGGPHVSSGYCRRPQETRDTFFADKNGTRWYVTGDIVELNLQSGSLRIIDRKKDLVKMANGEFISLGKIEAALKLDPFVENVFVHARNNNCIAFIVPSVEHITLLAHKLQVDGDLTTICSSESVYSHVIHSLKETARMANLSPIETPKQIFLEATNPWTPENGLVTATFKVRRKQLEHFYQKTIAEFTSFK